MNVVVREVPLKRCVELRPAALILCGVSEWTNEWAKGPMNGPISGPVNGPISGPVNGPNVVDGDQMSRVGG